MGFLGPGRFRRVSARATPGEELRGPPHLAKGEIVVAVVVDFGGVDAKVLVSCVTARTGETGAEVLQAQGRATGYPTPRYDESGLLCAIDGYPTSGCGARVRRPLCLLGLLARRKALAVRERWPRGVDRRSRRRRGMALRARWERVSFRSAPAGGLECVRARNLCRHGAGRDDHDFGCRRCRPDRLGGDGLVHETDPLLRVSGADRSPRSRGPDSCPPRPRSRHLDAPRPPTAPAPDRVVVLGGLACDRGQSHDEPAPAGTHPGRGRLGRHHESRLEPVGALVRRAVATRPVRRRDPSRCPGPLR